MNESPTTPAGPPPPDPLAVALSKLDPAPHGFNREALMFAAGRASKENALTFWKWVAGIAIAAAVTFAGMYFLRSSNENEQPRFFSSSR
jgi:hypothetical protein